MNPLLVNSMNPSSVEHLRLGKYTRWIDYVREDEFLRQLEAVVAFDAAVFPAGEPRRVFPVWRLGTRHGSPIRVQLPLEALCMILELLTHAAAGFEVGTLVRRLERLGTPMRFFDETASPESPMSEALRATIRSRPPIAVFADVNEPMLGLILWQLGEIEIRTCWDDRELAAHPVEVISEKPYGESLGARYDDPICELMEGKAGPSNAEMVQRWTNAHVAFLILVRALHPRLHRS